METEKIIRDFYSTEREENRFSSKHGKVEYITTLKYIDKYLRTGHRILEIGCATGSYALHYARNGYRVDAVDLVQENLDILNKKIIGTDDITAIRGNALDLSVYLSDTFDITLLLGPMYHLFTERDKIQCLKEAVRVTKKGGIIFAAYCQFDAAMMQTGFIGKMYDNLVEKKFLDENTFLPVSGQAAIFELHRKEQIDALNKSIGVRRLHYVGTDMYTGYYQKEIDEMDDKMYRKYIEYTDTICENQNLVGISNHTLDILEKL